MQLEIVMLLGALSARAESWEDGLLPRIPVEGVAASVGGAALPNSGLWFGGTELGAGFRLEQIEELGVGATLQVEMQHGSSYQGQFTAAGPVGGGLWLVIRDAKGVHSLSATASLPVGARSFYRLHPSETGGRLSVSYVGLTRALPKLQLLTELRAGLSTVMEIDLAVAGSVHRVINPSLSLSGSVVVGYMPSGATLAGVHLRPLPEDGGFGLEVGLQGGLSLPLEQRLGPSVLAMAAIKGWWVGTAGSPR